MSLENLKKAIIAQAQQEAEAIVAQLNEQQTSEQQRILAHAQEIEESVIRQAERDGALLARRRRQSTELEARAAVLRAKEEELQATQGQLLALLLEEDPKPLVKALLALVPKEGGTIQAGEYHEKAIRGLAKGHTMQAASIPGEGGFVFRSKTAEINVTLSHLVASVFRKHRTTIAATLFS